MLKSYIRKWKDRCVNTVGNLVSSHTPPREWLVAACAELATRDGSREWLLAAMAAYVRRAARELDGWLAGGETGAALTRALLDGAFHLDRGAIFERGRPHRTYVDISVQVHALRVAIDYLSLLSLGILPVEPLELTAMLLEHEPQSRVALLAQAGVLLDDGDADAALEAVRHALRIQAVCQTAQEMLFRAYALQRAAGATAPEHEALDYDLSDKFCHLPFTHMSTGFRGETFACACPAWVPYSIGNVMEAESGEAIWNSPMAVEIRRSILDGDFRYCSRTLCSFISSQKLPRKEDVTTPKLRAVIDQRLTRLEQRPDMVELNHDPTCNLACPSCRTEIVAAKSDEVDEYGGAAERVILPFLKTVEGHTYITGGGEAFASKHFRSILRALNREEYPGLQVYLITNGLLMTPHRWSEFPNLPEMISIVAVSVDAARAETYEQLRRPGKWATLMKNLEFLAEMRRSGRIRNFGLNFVVQQANFREMVEFMALADSVSADQVWFQRVTNYGAYDEATFAKVDVTSPSHPEHAELLEVLRNPILRRPSTNMHMLLSLLPEFVASDERIEFLY